MAKSRLILYAILVAYILQIALYALATPAWESPDEPSHYLYVIHLAQYGSPPGPSPVPRVGRFYEGGYAASMYEWYHPALGYAWPALVWRGTNLLFPGLLPLDMPEINPDFPSSSGDPRVFSSSRTSFWTLNGTDWGIVILRVMTGLLGVPLILSVYYAARAVVDKDEIFAVATAGLVAFIPQFNFISATIRNDTTNNLMAAVLLLLLLKKIAAPESLRYREAGVFGLLLGVVLLTKATATFLIPVALLVFWWSPSSLWERIKMICLMLLVMLLVVALYVVVFPQARVAFHYSLTHAQAKPDHLRLSYILKIPGPLRDMFWARFGWANITVPAWWIRIANTCAMLGVAVSGTYLVYAYVKQRGSLVEKRQILLLFVALILNLFLILRYNLYEFQPQGRFLFPSLLPLSLLFLWGSWKVLPSRFRCFAAAILSLFMWSFTIFALFFHLIPSFY